MLPCESFLDTSQVTSVRHGQSDPMPGVHAMVTHLS